MKASWSGSMRTTGRNASWI